MANIDLVTSTHRHNLIIYEFIHNLRTTPPTPRNNLPHSIFIYSCPSGCNRPHYIFIYSRPSGCLYSAQITDFIIYSFIHAQAVAILLHACSSCHKLHQKLPSSALSLSDRNQPCLIWLLYVLYRVVGLRFNRFLIETLSMPKLSLK